jgi:hypothetical protein
MTFAEIVEILGNRLGIELYVHNGSCHVDVDDMTICIQEIEDIGGFCLVGEIGELPPLNAEAVMSALLTANHLFQGTGRATISRDPVTGNLFLCRYERLDFLDGDRVYDMFCNFVNTLEIWRETVANYHA